MVHALKYDSHPSIARRLGREMARHGADVLRGANACVPVPLHWLRQWRRGFNQAELLARQFDLPVWTALRRVRATPSQVALPADERRHNVRGAFALAGRPGAKAPGTDTSSGRWPLKIRRRKNWENVLKGKTLVLIDDVATTGSTLEACARVLRAAGAREVRALTAARVRGAR